MARKGAYAHSHYVVFPMLVSGGLPRTGKSAVGSLGEGFQQDLLRATAVLSLNRMAANIAPIGLEVPRLAIVCKEEAQNVVSEDPAIFRLLDRHDHFDTPVEVARHPVGAADIDLPLAIILKIEDAAM